MIKNAARSTARMSLTHILFSGKKVTTTVIELGSGDKLLRAPAAGSKDCC